MRPSSSRSFCSLLLFLGLGWHASAQPAAVPPINTLTEQEKKDGWKLLFDGKSLLTAKRLLSSRRMPAPGP